MAIKIVLLSGADESVIFESDPAGGTQDTMVPTSEQKESTQVVSRKFGQGTQSLQNL